MVVTQTPCSTASRGAFADITSDYCATAAEQRIPTSLPTSCIALEQHFRDTQMALGRDDFMVARLQSQSLM